MRSFGDIWWQLLILVVISYLIGNVNFAIIISKFRNKDITKSGSGNPGTMNMLRTFGVGLGALTLVLDMLKGLLPALAGYLLFMGKTSPGGLDWSVFSLYLAGFFAVLGHNFPLLHRRGGKGVATTIGVFLCGNWWLALVCFAVGVLYIFFFEWGGIGSLIMVTGFVAAEIAMLFFAYEISVEFWVLCAILFAFCILSFIKHRGNLLRMIRGTENRTKIRDMIFGKKRKSEPASEENPEGDKEQK